jgi:PLP dependent protein
MTDLLANYQNLMRHIGAAAAKAGRQRADVKLLGAAKSQPVELVQAAIEAGVGLIGENYVQEAQARKREIRKSIEWHMIGHLQRNKAKAAVDLFDVIETLDSAALARELDKEGAKRGKIVRAFIEVNLAGEESKGGIAQAQIKNLLEEAGQLAHIRIEGLMTVPPFREDPEDVRRYFRALCELRGEYTAWGGPNVDLKELSMGMTHDYMVAIEEGATIVRIGTALFGPRSH